VILGHFLFREHLTLQGWIAAGGAFTAALLLAGGKADGRILSIVLITLGCICWGFDNHLTALIDEISPAETTFWKGIFAGTFNLSISSTIAGEVGLPKVVFVALIVGVLSYGFSIMLYITAAQGLGAIRGQMIFSTAPFFGLLFSVTVLAEPFTGNQALAAGLMVISIIILSSEKHEHIHRHYPLSHEHTHRHDELHHDHQHDAYHLRVSHSHWHEHTSMEHSHIHCPDLHHRHRHKEN
jgi:drug/metabolite transporter (DMT)-like permease